MRRQVFEIGIERGDRELVRLTAAVAAGVLGNPDGELAEDPPIGIEGARGIVNLIHRQGCRLANRLH